MWMKLIGALLAASVWCGQAQAWDVEYCKRNSTPGNMEWCLSQVKPNQDSSQNNQNTAVVPPVTSSTKESKTEWEVVVEKIGFPGREREHHTVYSMQNQWGEELRPPFLSMARVGLLEPISRAWISPSLAFGDDVTSGGAYCELIGDLKGQDVKVRVSRTPDSRSTYCEVERDPLMGRRKTINVYEFKDASGRHAMRGGLYSETTGLCTGKGAFVFTVVFLNGEPGGSMRAPPIVKTERGGKIRVGYRTNEEVREAYGLVGFHSNSVNIAVVDESSSLDPSRFSSAVMLRYPGPWRFAVSIETDNGKMGVTIPLHDPRISAAMKPCFER